MNKNNEIIGIEILDAKERFSPSSVAEMSFKFSKNSFFEQLRCSIALQFEIKRLGKEISGDIKK